MPKEDSSKQNCPKSRDAFTILELLVAVAVLAVLVVLLMNLVDGATKLWKINENRVDGYREPRAALGIIARDLQNVLARTNTNYFRLNDPTLVPNGAETGTNASHVFFLSQLGKSSQWSVSVASNRSDVCQVGYFIGYGKTSSSSNAPMNTMNLYRYFLASDESYNKLIATNVSSYPFPDPSTLSLTDKNVELLARNIVFFSIKAYSAYSITNTNDNSVSQVLSKHIPSTTRPVPDLVEISISALNQDTARKLDNLSTWKDTNFAPVRENLQTFTTRLRLMNRP